MLRLAYRELRPRRHPDSGWHRRCTIPRENLLIGKGPRSMKRISIAVLSVFVALNLIQAPGAFAKDLNCKDTFDGRACLTRVAIGTGLGGFFGAVIGRNETAVRNG